jgi:hypothetical protein
VFRCMLLSAVSSRPPRTVFLPVLKCILLVPYAPHPKTLWHRAKARNSGLSDDMDALPLKALLFLLQWRNLSLGLITLTWGAVQLHTHLTSAPIKWYWMPPPP